MLLRHSLGLSLSAFTGSLTITEMDADMSRWQVVQPLIYEVGELGSGKVIEAPTGFETDFASIPWPVSMILPRWGRWGRAAVIHDFGYELISGGTPHPLMPTRKAADCVFHEAMLVSGVPRFLAFLMWVAVRIFGGSHVLRRWARETRSSKD